MSNSIRDALSRLTSALDRLDAVSIRHAEGERTRSTLETELALMREDRHALAVELDQERTHRVNAEDSLAELTPRIDRAMLAIRQSLSDQQG